MLRALAIPITAAALAACYHGPGADNFLPAQGPDGIEVDLRVARQRLRGELLEVQDTALLVVREGRVVLVPLASISAGTFHQRSDLVIRDGHLTDKQRAALRLVSRFPAGLTPELRARLLRAYGQAEVERVGAVPGGALDQHEFVARARRGTERFRDPAVARAAGYRPVGPDFPGMGQHWIHPGRILRDTPDPAEPPVLEYAEIQGHLTLVGVAYAVLVDGAEPPAGLPVPAGAWHFHGGTVEEESFVRAHATGEHGGDGPSIAVLHAWIWLDNPDGLLATDNWVLPYARLGLRPAPDAPREAARALALAAGDGGRGYVEALLRAVGRLTPADADAMRPVVSRHQAAAQRLVSTASPDLPVDRLAECWHALWSDVRNVLPADAWERLQAAR